MSMDRDQKIRFLKEIVFSAEEIQKDKKRKDEAWGQFDFDDEGAVAGFASNDRSTNATVTENNIFDDEEHRRYLKLQL